MLNAMRESVKICWWLDFLNLSSKLCLKIRCALQTPVIHALGVALHDPEIFPEPEKLVRT